MGDRYWNPYKPAKRYHTNEEEIREDVPREDLPGWNLPTPSGQYLERNGRASRVVTRPSDYVPYQSLAEPDGRHAYNPAGRQYPRSFREEQRSGRVAHRAADRQNLWDQIRPDPIYHPPGATIDLPLRDDYRNIRPAPPPAGNQAQAAGFMQPNQNPMPRPDIGAASATRPAGPQLRPLMPAPRQGPTPGPAQAPTRGPTQGPTRGSAQGPPLGDQAGVRGRGVGPNPRSARGGYGDAYARGNRGGRR
jgi:hypothetical protein